MNVEILIPNIQNAHISVQTVKVAPWDFYYEWHLHDECEMYICMKGNSKLFVEDKEYSLSDGDIFFINKRVPHKTFTSKETLSFLIQFSLENSAEDTISALRSVGSFEECDAVVFKKGTAVNDALSDCLMEILQENTTQQKAYSQYIKALLQKILAILYRNNVLYSGDELFQKKELMRFLPVIEYVHRHLCEKITLEDASNLLHIDKTHFCRIFKDAANISFSKYITLLRIRKAQKLLLETNKTILAISEETGFSSQSYFSECFKEINFCCPHDYRKMRKDNV